MIDASYTIRCDCENSQFIADNLSFGFECFGIWLTKFKWNDR